MKVSLVANHAQFPVKQAVSAHLRTKGHEVLQFSLRPASSRFPCLGRCRSRFVPGSEVCVRVDAFPAVSADTLENRQHKAGTAAIPASSYTLSGPEPCLGLHGACPEKAPLIFQLKIHDPP